MNNSISQLTTPQEPFSSEDRFNRDIESYNERPENYFVFVLNEYGGIVYDPDCMSPQKVISANAFIKRGEIFTAYKIHDQKNIDVNKSLVIIGRQNRLISCCINDGLGEYFLRIKSKNLNDLPVDTTIFAMIQTTRDVYFFAYDPETKMIIAHNSYLYNNDAVVLYNLYFNTKIPN